MPLSSRKLPIALLVSLLLAAGLAGCFHKDDGDDGDDGGDDGDGVTPPPDDNETNGDNNTTEPPEQPPVPSIKLTNSTGENFTGAAALDFVKGAGSGNINVTLDASNSTDPDGVINVYAWEVLGPQGFEFTENNVSARLEIAGDKGYGVYAVHLRVIDDDSNIAAANMTLYVGYDLLRTGKFCVCASGVEGPAAGNGMRGDAADSDGVNKNSHTFTVISNASRASLAVSWSGGSAATQVAAYVLAPGVTEHINSAPAGASPRTLELTASQLENPGAYTLETHLDGTTGAGALTYTWHVVVRYDPEGAV